MAQTEPVPETLAPLGPWLEARLADAEAIELLGVKKASSGFSADTTMVDVAVTRGGIVNEERYVLRTESPDPPVYPVQVPGWRVEIELQYRIMDALGAHSDVPVAPMVGYEDDASVLGAPFFVMGFLDGQVPVEDPAYTTAGFFLDLAPADAHRDDRNGLATLARVHAVDWRAVGLDWLVPAVSRRARRAARPVAGVRPRPSSEAASTRCRRRGRGWRRAAALQRGRALLGRPAARQHHLARRRRRSASPTSKRPPSRRRSSTSAGG